MIDNKASTNKASTNNFFGFYAVVILLLLAAGISSRWLLIDHPNFKPVAAIAIFCGFLFSHSRVGLLVGIGAVVGIMLISDATLGFYEWPTMFAVYSSMLLACVLGNLAGGWFANPTRLVQLGSLTTMAFVSSCIFFMLTNAAVVFAGWYPFSLAGFISSYAAGVPFFKFTVFGDLIFTIGIFSFYVLAKQLMEKLPTKWSVDLPVSNR